MTASFWTFVQFGIDVAPRSTSRHRGFILDCGPQYAATVRCLTRWFGPLDFRQRWSGKTADDCSPANMIGRHTVRSCRPGRVAPAWLGGGAGCLPCPSFRQRRPGTDVAGLRSCTISATRTSSCTANRSTGSSLISQTPNPLTGPPRSPSAAASARRSVALSAVKVADAVGFPGRISLRPGSPSFGGVDVIGVDDAVELVREELSTYVDLDAYAASIAKLNANLLERGEFIAPTR